MATKPKVVQAALTPTDDKKRIEVPIKLDEYYVVVGFEVNNPDAFKPGVVVSGKYIPDFVHEGDATVLIHDLGKDYGHAFFYIVKNDKVSKLFSFGPKADGKRGWLDKGSRIDTTSNKYDTGALVKDGRADARPGTPDYGISEVVTAFKIPLTAQLGIALQAKAQAMRTRIFDGDQSYTAYANDTCAETARDVLSNAGIDTPSGSGWVKQSKLVNFPLAYAVNPYMWHHNFVASKKYLTSKDYLKNGKVPSNLIGQYDPLTW